MKKNQKPWRFRAAAAGTLEVMLYDEIGESWWGDAGTTAKQFDADLKAAGDVSRIHLRINSVGGDVWQGIAIFNTLRDHGAAITAKVDGLAASIASVILMAADVGGITIAETGFIMVHNPATILAGDENSFRAMAETLSKVKGSMITAYKRHSPLSTAKISGLLDAETWMDSQQSIDNGFADTISEDDDADQDQSDEDLAAALAAPIMAKFKHAPPGLAARLARRESQSVADEVRDLQRGRLELLKRL